MLDHLKIPSSNRLHDLGDDPAGQHSISINDQKRICFRRVGRPGLTAGISQNPRIA
jgi:plasmid maintenance system killer protein